MGLRRTESCALRTVMRDRVPSACSSARRGRDDACIWDGACLAANPAGAHALVSYRQDIERVSAWVREGRRVVASLAPSYVAGFGDAPPGSVVAALRALGFAWIEETASALPETVLRRAACLAESRAVALSSSCPAVTALIRRYYPGAASFLVPVPSPMLAHCARLRRDWGPGAAVVFIGPCLAKKREVFLMRTRSSRTGARAPVDACLTFAELGAWIREAGIDLAALQPTSPDVETPPEARFGLLQVGVCGLDECVRFLERLVAGRGGAPADGTPPDSAAQGGAAFVELLACVGGCLGGPGMCDAVSGAGAGVVWDVVSGVGAEAAAARAAACEPEHMRAPDDEHGPAPDDARARIAVRRKRAFMWALGQL